jgi:hypothetical protein
MFLKRTNVPLNSKLATAHMWHDIERRAGRCIPIRVPAPYPPPKLEVAIRIAILEDKER